MIVLTFPAMLMLLIPIILVECLLCKKWLGLTTWEALKSNAVSNLASTIVGVPVAWAIMLGVEFATIGLVEWTHPKQDWNSPIANVIFFFMGSAWIGPPNEKNLWDIPAATLVLLLPFFFASYGIEYLVIRSICGCARRRSTELIIFSGANRSSECQSNNLRRYVRWHSPLASYPDTSPLGERLNGRFSAPKKIGCDCDGQIFLTLGIIIRPSAISLRIA
jgi:hypothetical protein